MLSKQGSPRRKDLLKFSIAQGQTPAQPDNLLARVKQRIIAAKQDAFAGMPVHNAGQGVVVNKRQRARRVDIDIFPDKMLKYVLPMQIPPHMGGNDGQIGEIAQDGRHLGRTGIVLFGRQTVADVQHDDKPAG